MRCPKCLWDTLAIPTASWVLEFPAPIPSVNELKSNTRMNHAYRRYRKGYERLIGEFGDHVPRTKAMPRRVTITRRYGKGKRKFDRVNFAHGCKPLLDSLTAHGLIYDDTEAWVLDYYAQEPSPDGVDWVHILLEELP